VNELERMLTQLIGGEGGSEQNTITRTTTDVEDTSYLYQNKPNPTHNSTDIEYRLPSKLSTAQIVIQDLNGNKITGFNLQGTGSGKITFNAGQFGMTSGTYVYSLIVDGVVTGSKKMIFIN